MLKDKEEVYKTLKNMTLEELANVFNSTNKVEVIEKVEKIQIDDNKVLYTVNELLEKYPFFTRYNLNKAIQRDGLPCCFIGNKRMFSKEEIEKWLEKETKPKKEKEKVKYDI